MKKGFSLITAVIFIVLIATIGAISLTLSNVTSKQTGDLYLKSQAKLLAQSATEFALLSIIGHDRTLGAGSCVNQINATFPSAGANKLFDINVSINYLGNGLPAGCTTLSNSIVNTQSNPTVLIDTIVTSVGANEPIRYHKRTLQRP